MKTDNFELIEFNLSDKEHLIFLEQMIKSDGSELISEDIKRFVERNIELKKKDNINGSVENDIEART